MIDSMAAATLAQARHDDDLRGLADERTLAWRRWAREHADERRRARRENLRSMLRWPARRRGRVLEPRHAT